MESVLWYVIPLGIAMAFSIFPILATILLLLSRRPVPSSASYLAGWSIGVFVLVSLFALGAALIPPAPDSTTPAWVHVAEIVIGVAIALWGAVTLRRPPRSEAPGWTSSLSGISPRRAFAFGIAMNLRPKNLTLALAAGLAIGSGRLSLVGVGIAVIVFTAIAVSTVAGLVIAYLIGATRVRPVLERLGGWLIRHATTVLRATMILIGVLLAVLGAAHLLGA